MIPCITFLYIKRHVDFFLILFITIRQLVIDHLHNTVYNTGQQKQVQGNIFYHFMNFNEIVTSELQINQRYAHISVLFWRTIFSLRFCTSI